MINDTLVDIFREHFDFSDVLEDNNEYQDAQRDLGEIEYISCSHPEDTIADIESKWCYKHPDVVLSFFALHPEFFTSSSTKVDKSEE